MSQLPPIVNVTYNKTKHGYFGELGTGANARVKFLQTALSVDELDTVTLIENIPGSETWDVRDLFQRDVDKERVTQAILPYLKDKTRVKFFNPLTLALLPMSANGQTIEASLPYVIPADVEESGHPYTKFEWDGYYKFGLHRQAPAFSSLSWNDQRVRIVAIDGQHRLSALKRWKNEPPSSSQELNTWTIPVVVLGIFKAEPDKPTASFLEIVRKTFVYINSTAQKINQARETLLNDESVLAVCTQELVQDSHSNDVLPQDSRDNEKLPLLLFDWRGETRNNVRIPAPAALVTVEELHDWLGWYLIDEDGSDEQASALGLEDLIPKLSTFGPGKKLSYQDAARLRQQFKATILPGLRHVLENFTPYKTYIKECRQMERAALLESDLAQHAFTKLRFGTAKASDDIVSLVNKKYEDLVLRFEALKGKTFDELILRDVGMRAVMSAFGWGKGVYDDDKDKTSSWLEYGQWFTPHLNSVYEEGWFRSFEKLDQSKRSVLKHVVFDPSGSIVNYRVQDVGSAFGAMLFLLVFVRGKNGFKAATIERIWDEGSEELKSPLRSGYRREYKAELNETFKGTPAQLKEEIQRKASAAVDRHISRVKGAVGA